MKSVENLAHIAILSAFAFVLYLFEIALPLFPVFLRLDFSDLIPILTTLFLGLEPAIGVQLLKNLLHMLFLGNTAGIGELTGFLTGSAYCFTLYHAGPRCFPADRLHRGLLWGTLAMTFTGALVNLLLALPLYSLILDIPLRQIILQSSRFIPVIRDRFTLILYAVIPFNLIKGTLLSLCAFPLARRLAPEFKKKKDD